MTEKSFALDRGQMRRAFERAAPAYERAAWLQREIGARLLARLDVIKLVPTRVLDLGCGSGYCTRALRKRYRQTEVIGLDIAPAMLRAARRRDGWWRRNRWLGGDAERLPFAAASFDMVISNLSLQWCDPERVFPEVARVLRPGGLFMFTSFGPDTLRELRHAWAAVDGAPHVHGFIDMHDLGDALMRARLAEPVMDVDRLTLTYKDVMSLLRELKDIGAHNVAHDRPRALTGKDRFARFRAAYEAKARDGRIPATYEVVYGQAWGPPAASAGVAVPLTQLRRPGK
ncbi:MAG: malonyl-ACP O-methyltransferase BioC [Gammaproteobacteria bacterium]|nr:malonyl-ACP O-methyltransferase BioC [Gammaproteobacteria bacterium]